MKWENEEDAVVMKDLTVRYRMPREKIDGIKEYLDKAIMRKLEHKEFVALKNINLTIKQGERIGIIGHNGAGKSTLLKAIAHVIKPSEGSVDVIGSIAPLLELGAGFDLELTGIENIYLNGSILGRSKGYLDAVMEDIIRFAELGEFIKYPVKNYSSGMRAKLGFAIAVQVDADILIVDEVFGVGDENFKRKSKAKMVEMINSGKTVIIVSHDMTQIVDFTDRVIWMHNGEIAAQGEPGKICDRYCEYMLEHQNVIIEHRKAKVVKKEGKKAKKKKRIKKADKNAEKKNPEVLVRTEPMVRGKVDVCKYYKDEQILYMKGWNLPVHAYTNIKMSIEGNIIGEADCHLHRTGIYKGSRYPLDKFAGWEFIKQVSFPPQEVTVLICQNDKPEMAVVSKTEVTTEACPENIIWKSKHKHTEKECLKIYQKYFMGGFNLISLQTRRRYYALFENYEDIGYLFKRNYMSMERELGFDLQVNELGLRGPCDRKAHHIVFGLGNGLGLSVDEDHTWYARDYFRRGWMNLSFICNTGQLKRMMQRYLKDSQPKKTAVLIYEASFWNSYAKDGKKTDEEIDRLNWENYFIQEQEDFLGFYNRMYEGNFREIQKDQTFFLNACYAKFDFNSKVNEQVIDHIMKDWCVILQQFGKAICIRLPNREYICAQQEEYDFLQLLKKEQDLGWKIFQEGLAGLKNIEFVEMTDFNLSDYCLTTSSLNQKGSQKLGKWIRTVAEIY